MALTEKIREIIGALTDTWNGGDTDSYPEYPYEGESEGISANYPTDMNAALNPVLAETNPLEKKKPNIRLLSQHKSGAYEVVVIEPKAYNESITIAEALKDRKTVILNLQLLDREQSQRIVDFLCGCTHALNGSQRKIGENVFIFTPSNVNVSQEMVNSRLTSDAMWTNSSVTK